LRSYNIGLFALCIVLLQGGWENDETVEEAAAREAIEEAGVRGDLVVRY
jgi:8-oxo-dGTP pyrophosphatase MutT (NUDIX family)